VASVHARIKKILKNISRSPVTLLAAWAAAEGELRGSYPCAFVLAPRLPPGQILIIKCLLVTIRMPRCDLLNVIFATQHRNLGLFTFPNINFGHSSERPKAKSVSASGGLRLPGPLTRAVPLDPVTSFCCTQQLNIMVDSGPTPKKSIARVPWPLFHERCLPGLDS